MPILFSEELGLVIEYLPKNEDEILSVFKNFSVPCEIIGKTSSEKRITLLNQSPIPNAQPILDEDMLILRGIWEETSYQLERLQTNPD